MIENHGSARTLLRKREHLRHQIAKLSIDIEFGGGDPGKTARERVQSYLTAERGRECRLESRLRALCTAVEQLVEGGDDDGECALVRSEALRCAQGVAKRNREDLDSGGL